MEREALARVLDCIEQSLRTDLTLPELAGVAGYSVHHFARLFCAQMGESPMEYLGGGGSRASPGNWRKGTRPLT